MLARQSLRVEVKDPLWRVIAERQRSARDRRNFVGCDTPVWACAEFDGFAVLVSKRFVAIKRRLHLFVNFLRILVGFGEVCGNAADAANLNLGQATLR